MGGSGATDRSESINAVLFLRRHLLLDLTPSADLETAADPAKRFRAHRGSLRSADRANRELLEPVRRERALRLLQNLRWHNYLGFCLWLPSHISPIPRYCSHYGRNPSLETTQSFIPL